ncbi:UNKNOWN [Stylonychia lemnae]|uniref:Uncharacterized protein n=1 Tax=Stylonychia lemnae TaxID=5949 RepID=A0A078B6Q7_STYLE|nr:UNKNOWN [Stylonychia lemnae]|eukprot:CDW88972.1 UNKNOWN [Stylonychia lemnae]
MGESLSKSIKRQYFEMRGGDNAKDKLIAIMDHLGEEDVFDKLIANQGTPEYVAYVDKHGNLDLTGDLNDFYDNLTDSQAQALIQWYETNATA